VSQRKAYSSATLRSATSQMGARSDLSFAPDILLIVGGVPISFSGIFMEVLQFQVQSLI